MFEQTFLEQGGSTRRPWPVALSFAAQAALTAVIAIVPLLRTAQLALRPTPLTLYLPPRPAPPPPEMPLKTGAVAAQMLRPVFRPVFAAPRHIPAAVSMLPDTLPAPEMLLSSAAGPVDALPFAPPGIGAESRPAASAPLPVGKAAPHEPLRVGGAVQAAKLVAQPRPEYPAMARMARISGKVRLQAIVGRDGSIRNLQLIGGPPLLVKAALDAVSRWRYQPTLLNGEPVEVFTEIEVNFTLNQ